MITHLIKWILAPLLLGAKLLFAAELGEAAKPAITTTPSDELVQACLEGQTTRVRELMQQGLDLSQLSQEPVAISPIFALCLSSKMPKDEKYALLKTFLDAKVDINQRCLSGTTALDAVAAQGDLELARYLIAHGADLNAQDDYESSPLMVALTAENIEMMQLLLEQGADPHQRALSCTLLHLAVARGSLKVLQFLLSLEGEQQIDAQLKSADGKTALDLAREMKQEEMAQLLLQHSSAAH